MDWRRVTGTYFLQHFAQPAASVQLLAQVAPSLQQLPSHFIAGLVQAPSFLQQVEQPAVISNPAANTVARISIVLIIFLAVRGLAFHQ